MATDYKPSQELERLQLLFIPSRCALLGLLSAGVRLQTVPLPALQTWRSPSAAVRRALVHREQGLPAVPVGDGSEGLSVCLSVPLLWQQHLLTRD